MSNRRFLSSVTKQHERLLAKLDEQFMQLLEHTSTPIALPAPLPLVVVYGGRMEPGVDVKNGGSAGFVLHVTHIERRDIGYGVTNIAYNLANFKRSISRGGVISCVDLRDLSASELIELLDQLPPA